MAVQVKIKSRPILFSGAMVRAILKSSKVQTRRVVKPKCGCPDFYLFKEAESYPYYFRRKDSCWDSFRTIEKLATKYCPYGTVGDRLWVRETWCEGFSDSHECWGYRADMKYQCGKDIPDEGMLKKWKPSIFMPRSHSRILLEVESIRVERVNEISEEDAIAEGIFKMSSGFWTGGLHKIKGTYKHMPSAAEGFEDLWNSINGEKYPWDSNPLVWVVSFKILEQSKCQ